MILSATLVLANFGGQQANAQIGKITGALERSVLLTNRPRPRTRPRPRPRLLLVRLERYQPVGSIGYGFFRSRNRSYLQSKVEFEDDNSAGAMRRSGTP